MRQHFFYRVGLSRLSRLISMCGTNIGQGVVVIFSLLTVFVTTVPAVARAARRSVSRCAPAHTRVIAADARAEVFEALQQPFVLHELPGELEEEAIYGCVYPDGRSHLLGYLPYGYGVSEVIRHETLAGTIVAYEETSVSGYGYRQAGWRIVVRNLRNGAVLHRVATGTPAAGSKYVGVGSAVAVVVENNGAVAWIAHDDEHTSDAGTQSEVVYFDVEAVDRSGGHLLASGPDISSSSLAMAGRTVYWTQDGAPRFAVLH
jgi:hypothetical protein